MARNKVCVVIGAGDATGGAIARRFAREGYTAVVTRRTADKLKPLVAEITKEGGKVHPFGSDARDEEQVIKLFREIETEIGEIEVFVFNIGGTKFETQKVLDQFMPHLLPLLLVMFVWWLVARKRVSATVVMVGMLIIGILGAIPIFPGVDSAGKAIMVGLFG